MNRLSSFFGIVLSALVFFGHALWAQDGLRGAFSQSTERERVLFALDQNLVAADFDNDEKPDGAVLLDSGLINQERAFRIELHLTGHRNSSISFSSRETQLAITSLDVNRDGTPDIMVEKFLTHQRVRVYLNDGNGGFRIVTSEAFPTPDDSEPLWRERMSSQNLPMPFVPVTRGFELASGQAALALRGGDTRRPSFWPAALRTQCGARAPSASRAPPSLRFL